MSKKGPKVSKRGTSTLLNKNTRVKESLYLAPTHFYEIKNVINNLKDKAGGMTLIKFILKY